MTKIKSKIIRKKAQKAKTKVYPKLKKIEAAPAPVPATYEEAIIRNILFGNSKENTNSDALIFSELISNLTSQMRKSNYQAGMYAGKTLYRVLNGANKYRWRDDAIPDLVSFFNNAGYKAVTYSITPMRTTFRIYDKHRFYSGAKMHAFEAGLISGFITAASRQYIGASEVKCANDNSDYCEFVATPSRATDRIPNNPDLGSTITRFATHVSDSLRQKEDKTAPVTKSYHLLQSVILSNSDYAPMARSVAACVGSELSKKLFGNEANGALRMRELKYIAESTRLLNLGTISIKDSRKPSLDISFDAMNSKNGLVEFSVAFVNGMLGITDREVSAEERNKGDAYVVNLTASKR